MQPVIQGTFFGLSTIVVIIVSCFYGMLKHCNRVTSWPLIFCIEDSDI